MSQVLLLSAGKKRPELGQPRCMVGASAGVAHVALLALLPFLEVGFGSESQPAAKSSFLSWEPSCLDLGP